METSKAAEERLVMAGSEDNSSQTVGKMDTRVGGQPAPINDQMQLDQR